MCMACLEYVFVERVKNKSTEKKIRDPTGIQTLNTSQSSYRIATWTPGRGAEDNAT